MGQWKWQHSKQPVKVGAFISLFAKMKFWASQYPTVLEILVLKFMIIICKWHFQGYSHWARRYSGALGPLGRGHCMALRSAKFSVLLYHIPHIFLLSYCFPIHPISHCRGDGKWDGYRCPNKFPYLCEKGNTSSPVNIHCSHTNKESHNHVSPAAEVAASSLPEATTEEPPVSSPSSCTAVTLPAASWVGFLIP